VGTIQVAELAGVKSEGGIKIDSWFLALNGGKSFPTLEMTNVASAYGIYQCVPEAFG
jgi:hypothetical protein